MISFALTIGGSKMDNVFHFQGSNYASLRHMVYAIEGIGHEQNEALTREEQRVVWDANNKLAIFRVTDKFTKENKVIEFSIEGIQSDAAPTPRNVMVNGKQTGAINFVFHDNMNMIGVRELSRLAGLEPYLQWYNKDNVQRVDLRVEDPLYWFGSQKEAIDAIVKKQNGIPSRTGGDFYQVLYGTANAGGKVNRYSGYGFSVMDALQWLIQTGGDISFALQIRDTALLQDKKGQVQAAVEGQWGIIQQFISAKELLSKCGHQVKWPGFIVGTPEENVKVSSYGAQGAIEIYEGLINKLVSAGCSGSEAGKIIKGIYFGSETAKSDANMIKEIREFIVSKGGKLFWIPYFMTREDLGQIEKTAVSFDKVILQPSTFYSKDVYYEGRNADGSYKSKREDRLKWKDIFDMVATDANKYGIELEFDMGLVTGRGDRKPSMTPADKREAFIEYINHIIPHIGEFPIGIYSGGPNEQGYNNILVNNNLHNDENHVPTVAGFGTGSNYSSLYGGNLIHEINGILFADKPNQWKQAGLLELVGKI